jgi:hypothetical protein
VKDTVIVAEAIEGLQAMAEAAAEGQLQPLTASAVAAAATLNIVETISFIEQDFPDAPESGFDSAVATKPIDIIEFEQVEDNRDEKPEDKDLF